MASLQPVLSRLQATLNAFSSQEVGGTAGGGVSRPAGSDQDKAVRDLFTTTAQNLGLTVRVDDVGNMYARRPGLDADALPVIIGSHLDTVVPGGRFDGILGVTVALETIALLNDEGLQTQRPIDVVNWTGEEGARFPPAMIGSGVIAGVWDGDYARARTDAEGITLGIELERIGYLGNAINRLGPFFASLEVHIEQGTQLEEASADVGIVPFIEPVRWFTVQVSGVGGHAGGPGPAGRSEAMVAASRMIVAARNSSLAATDFKTTVGTLTVEPGSNNVIPHGVTFNLDIRAANDHLLDKRLAGLNGTFSEIAAEEGAQVDMNLTFALPSTSFDENVRELLQQTAKNRDVRWAITPGHIGHDSLYLAALGPTAMLFTRTRKGLSHCEEEFAPWDAVAATAGIYADATIALANSTSLTDLVSIQKFRENA